MTPARRLVFALALCSAIAPRLPADARAPAATGWVDECASDPSFADYRRRLERAVRARDPLALKSLVSPRVEVDFGGHAGFPAFARAWKLDRPRQSRLWDELAQVMRLGCRREQDVLVMPAYFSALPEGTDAASVVVATRAGALWRGQSGAGTPIGRLRRGEVLTLLGAQAGERSWLSVRHSSMGDAYVRAADVRSPLDYRAFFGREGGRWVMTAFVAGD